MVLAMRIHPLEWRKRRHLPLKRSLRDRNEMQKGSVSLLTGQGPDPLRCWFPKAGRGGNIVRVRVPELEGFAIELLSPSFCTTFITAPEDSRLSVGAMLPILTLNVEYLDLPFCFEFQLLDHSHSKRRFRCSTVQLACKLSTLSCIMPLYLESGWNKIEIDLASLLQLTYNTRFVEILGLTIYANCRVKHVFFSDRIYEQSELPKELALKEPIPRFKKEAYNSYRESYRHATTLYGIC